MTHYDASPATFVVTDNETGGHFPSPDLVRHCEEQPVGMRQLERDEAIQSLKLIVQLSGLPRIVPMLAMTIAKTVLRHPDESRGPVVCPHFTASKNWIPAFAGMTNAGVI